MLDPAPWHALAGEVILAVVGAYAHQGFDGCGHFAKANELLASAGSAPIDWTRG
jgi:hypothetical protein